MQISEIKMVDIPDIDLSQLGVTKYGKFSVEVVDPVSDYLELMEVRIRSYSCSEYHMTHFLVIISNGMVFCAECVRFFTNQKSTITVRFQVINELII